MNPVLLTRNSEEEIVLMDIDTYSQRKEELALAQRLSAAEQARFSGTRDLSVEEFEKNMQEAIVFGATQKN